MSLFWRLYVPPLVTCAGSGLVVVALLLRDPEPRELEVTFITLGVVLSALLTAMFVRGGLAPLGVLHQALQEVTERGSGPVRVYRDDEIGRLAREYNTLVHRLEEHRHVSLQLALQAQEAERLRIARELHDEVGQTLTLVQRKIQQIQGYGDSAVISEKLRRVGATVGSLLTSVREISEQLRPDILDDLGLVPALRELVRRIEETGTIRVQSSLRRPRAPLSDEVQVAVYRIAQEALTNIVRHAGAHHVTFVFRPDRDYLHLSVRDDGSGAVGAAGSGQRGMRERASIIGGDLSIVSMPGHGTTVNLRVPISRSQHR